MKFKILVINQVQLVSVGIYLYILEAGDFSQNKKMNVIDELNDFINQTKESKEIKRA